MTFDDMARLFSIIFIIAAIVWVYLMMIAFQEFTDTKSKILQNCESIGGHGLVFENHGIVKCEKITINDKKYIRLYKMTQDGFEILKD